MNASLLEIYRNKTWDLGPEDLHALRDGLLAAIQLHASTSADELKKMQGFLLSKERGFQDRLYVDDVRSLQAKLYWGDIELKDDDQFINVVRINGPITRDGGACSYGSIEHYHQMEWANSLKQTIGHILIINTPGGATASRADYKQAIQESRALGKPCIAFIDGICCSMGMHIASQCDLIISRSEDNNVGCIGTMAAFFTMKDGDTNSITQERYVEVYPDESPDKNLNYRQAAEGDYTTIRAELKDAVERFHADVKAGRPDITDDLLTGKVYKAGDVLGTLVDEVGNLQHAINSIFALYDDMTKSRFGKSDAPGTTTENPDDDPDNEDPDNGDPENDDPENDDPDNETHEGEAAQSDPKEPTALDQAAIPAGPTGEAEEAQVAQEAQTATEEPEAQAATESPEAGEGTDPEPEPEPTPEPEPEPEPAAATVAEPTGEAVAPEATEQPAEQPAEAPTEEPVGTTTPSTPSDIAAALEAMRAEHEKQMQEMQGLVEAQREAHAKEVDKLRQQMGQMQGQLTQAQSDLAAARKEVEELSVEAPAAPAPAAPASNGVGRTVVTPRQANNVIAPTMTGREAAAAQKARMEELRRLRNGG